MITATLLASLFGLAVIDSINPSALVAAALILAKAPERKTLAIMWYVAGVYVANVAFGIALMLGLGAFLATFDNVLESRAAYILQAILGAAMLAWGLFSKPRARGTGRLTPRLFTFKTLFLLGAAITLTEVVTAFPYFAALAIMGQNELSIPVGVIILLFYNVIFVAPPLILALIYRFNKERFEAWLQKRQANSKPSDAMQWIVGIIGLLLLQNAVSTLGVFG